MDTIEKALKKHQLSTESALREQENESSNRSSSIESTEERSSAANNPEPRVKLSRDRQTDSSDRSGYLALDLDALSELGIILPDDKRSKIKEEYKHIKRPLLQKASVGSIAMNHHNLIMVTSSYSGEGKTFSSLNLAMSIAVERDCRVLLVDADVVKPGMEKLLKMEGRPGLVEYLNGEVGSFGDILLNTNVQNLTIAPAGKTHHLSHELLASNAMRDLMEELATRYSDRVVIFDCPPLLVTSEAKVLSKLVGQIVLVVEQDKTSQSAVMDSIAMLERQKLSGLILNKSKSAREAYYGYYYSENQ